MEGKILTLTLLSVVLTGIGAIIVDIPQPMYEVARGKNITLPCTYTTTKTNKPVLMAWSLPEQDGADEIEIITYYSDVNIDTSPQYQGRVSLDMDIPSRRFNLQLSSVTLDDNKIFKCRVQIPSDTGKQSDTTRLVVLVAPSTPECGIQGKAEYGQNINLTCASREGSPPPTYSWAAFDVLNKPRILDPKTSNVNGGILSLYNISSDTSGFFNCTSTNKIGSAMCTIKLAVMPPSMNIGSTAGIVAGVAVALLLFGIVVYCCCCRRKKNKEEDYAMGVPDEESHDKALPINAERPHAEGQEEIHSSDNSYVKSSADRNEKPSGRVYDKPSDYDDRRSDYDDRRSDYDDRRSDYDDRRSDYDDRRSDYSDRRDKYTDRRERYDDERRYNDNRNRRYEDDRYDEPYDRSHDKPLVPSNKPPRRNYD
ncbi:Cell surface A33 antigen Glycoprotein A33 [Channa argus]|uniref:Cell surface A33 antigen Glycoprotein A33 n=1 Tax=Channa argus TaxID=215402 RepID=A0A6G1P8M4_CHAAH|nr:Cell surface A33 antigen Glycoprotein A33 [Channa argus]